MDLYYKAINEEGALIKENFVPIHKNFFIDTFKNGCGIREAEVYYCLIDQNRHYVINNSNNLYGADFRLYGLFSKTLLF
jgi:hypothetical protein